MSWRKLVDKERKEILWEERSHKAKETKRCLPNGEKEIIENETLMSQEIVYVLKRKKEIWEKREKL